MGTPSEGGAPLGWERVWAKPRWWRREYELRAGERVIGGLRWESGWRSMAVAEVEGMRWRFARKGAFRTRVVATDAASGLEVASYESGWNGGGALFLPDGRTYGLRRVGFWRMAWEWRRADGAPIMRFRRRSAWSGREELVEILDPDAAGAETTLLVALGWYLILLAQAAAASASAAGAGV